MVNKNITSKVIFLFLFLLLHCRAQNLIKFGVQFPQTGDAGTFGKIRAQIALLAAETINSKKIIPNYTMSLTVLDTRSVRPGVVGTSISCSLDVGFDSDPTVDACLGSIGADTSEFAQLMQYVFQNYKVPQISPMATSTVLSDKNQYPTFLRSTPSDAAAGTAFAQIICHFGWRQVGLLVGSDAYSLSLYRSFITATKICNISLAEEIIMETNAPNYAAHISKLKNAYIQIFVLFAESADIEKILSEAYKQQILGKDFVWLGGDTFHSLDNKNLPPLSALLGTLVIAAAPTTDTELTKEFLNLTSETNISDYYGGFIFDAVYSFAYASKRLVETSTPINRGSMLQALKEITFEGVSGTVFYDQNGDRSDAYYNVASFDSEGEIQTRGTIIEKGIYESDEPIIWSDGTTNVPPDALHIINHPPRKSVRRAFEVVSGIMLAILILLILAFFAVLFVKRPALHVRLGHILLHVTNGVGGIFGFIAVILIVSGVSDGHCTAAVVLMDISLLICGGALSLTTLMKFVVEYKDHSKQGIITPRFAAYILFTIWAVLGLLNVVVLIATLSHSPPDTQLHLLEKNIYEYRCEFSRAAIIILPLTIGLLFIFSFCTTLLKIFVNRAVATKKNDIVNSVNNIITLFALVVATVTLILIEPTQTQIDITICLVILLANLSAPTSLLGWFYSPKRKEVIFHGLVDKDPLSPRQQAHRRRSSSLSPSLSSSLSSLSSTPLHPLSSTPSSSAPSSSVSTSASSLFVSHIAHSPSSPRSQQQKHQSLSVADLNSF